MAKSTNQKRLSKNVISRRSKKINLTKRINRMKTVIEVQEIVKEYGKSGKGYSQVWIFENIIDAPGSTFHMAEPTFRSYLTEPSPKQQLKELQEELNELNNPCE